VVAEVVRAPVERAWALSVDIDRAREWLPEDVVVEKLFDGPARVGSRYRESRWILGRRDVREYEISALEPLRASEVVSRGLGEFRFRLEYEAVDASTTRLTMSGSATGLGCLGVLAAPIVRSVLRKNMDLDFARLKAWIERAA
jgi:hypothetical protein